MAAESKSVALTMQSASTECKLMVAAEHNDIDMLYQLIEEDTNVLHRMDKMGVVDTPLHMASSEGCVDFAMEMMYLKPSLAKKLNKEGLSPVHVALQCGHTELALSLLRLDKTLIGVKGKMGYTPLHYLVMYEKKKDYLNKFFNEYHPCINDDLTSQGETALHVAAGCNNEALKYLLKWLRTTAKISMLKKHNLLKVGNRDKETVLHVLARTQPDPQIVKLLSIDFRINTEVKNSKGQTALQILESSDKKGNVDIEECMPILRHAKWWDPVVILRKTPFYIMAMIAQWGYEIKTMSPNNGNAMLVVIVLILTTSYQASLSPPGGVLPADVPENNNKNKFSNLQVYIGSINGTTSSNHSYHVLENIEFKPNNSTVGSSILKKGLFLWFFIPNILAFSTSFLLTCLVIPTLVSGFFSCVLTLSLSTLLFCLLDSALVIISPNNQTSQIIFTCVYTVVYTTYLAIAFVVVPKMRKYVIS
ncbi:ankyrin repeat-containing protein BDA1-like [Gossypium arboreum]|nr:ankyrin repeat-containing protein BDA1-like [Gossypium arboreum]